MAINDNEETLRYEVRIEPTKELMARTAMEFHAKMIADHNFGETNLPTEVFDLFAPGRPIYRGTRF